MADILIKFDPTVDIEDIKMSLNTPTAEEEPENQEMGEYQQTKVEGISAPLVRLNDIVIISNQIIRFEMHSNPTPVVDVEIDDRWGIARSLDSPKSDNLMVVQVIPPFDNGYKKMNLRFYITNYYTKGSHVVVHGVYNVALQHDITLESFGKKTTYELAELVAQRLKLGLASNMEGTDDSRWMYCPSRTLLETLSDEVSLGGNQTQILDWWIDYWNYLNIVDIYDRYNNNDNDIKIWTMTTSGVELNESNSTEPAMVDAVLTNHPSMNGAPLFVSRYHINSNTYGNISAGTDKTIETYSLFDLNSSKTDVMDGDVYNDIFKKYDYAGEIFGDTNYLLQRELNRSFMQKMRSQYIDIEIAKPQFGLARGGRVNFNWYECNEFVNRAMESQNDDMETNNLKIDTTDRDSEEYDLTGNLMDDTWILNKTISGQYYILDSWFVYDTKLGGMNWHHFLRLCRPADGVETYLENIERTTQSDGQQESGSGDTSGMLGRLGRMLSDRYHGHN